MNYKSFIRLFLFSMFLLGCLSCSKDVALTQTISEENAALKQSHISDEDITYDTHGLRLALSLEEALKRGITEKEYFSTIRIISEMNEEITQVLATKSGEEVVAYGFLRISTDNQNTGIATTPISFDYDALRIISHFSVPHTYGTNMVCVDAPDLLDLYYYIGSGQINKNYAFTGSSVS